MEKPQNNINPKDGGEDSPQGTTHLDGLYQNWFLDYASYVILERAVPALEDGLKPVQRRILHAMKEMDDGRFNKVANIIGQSMQYHPHGDSSIGEAIVNLGQKDLLLEPQGNWGDIRTGDDAAASRYIEARLSRFALEVAFNPKTTSWQLSYDGRKKEPLALPMKFPLLLAQGAEGIAVGLSTRILPHNFCELIEAAIRCLKGKSFELYPDFPTGGMIDVSHYQDGSRGGRVRVRTHIEEKDKKTLLIRDVPFGISTIQLMDSIVKANDAGKIRIRKVVDNTAQEVEIELQLAPGISPDITIDALYAFTDCEVSLAPNACVIWQDKPLFTSVKETLIRSVEHTRNLLGEELRIRLGELRDDWHYSSLEKIFIEKRIYRRIEEAQSWEEVLGEIRRGLLPYRKKLNREITQEDLLRLTEIRIKRISRYDGVRADDHIRMLEQEIAQVEHDLGHLVDYTVNYYESLLKKYGRGRERKTEIRAFDTIQATSVAIANARMYMNREEGFIGTGLKKDEFVGECSDLDQVIVLRHDGIMLVTRVAEKAFVGKGIMHAEIFRKNDERTTYNLVYTDLESGITFAKRFHVTGITRDKEYGLGRGDRSKAHYLSANPNGEAEILQVILSPNCSAKKKSFEFDFGNLEIKNRNSVGNQVTKYPVKQVRLKEKGISTLSGIRIWLDERIGRLNTEQRGRYLGSFEGGDLLLAIYSNGSYELTGYEQTNRFDPETLILLEKFSPDNPITAIYRDGDRKVYYIKRFLIETQTLNNRFPFIREAAGNRLVLATTRENPEVELLTGRKRSEAKLSRLKLAGLVEVMGWKAQGNKFCGDELNKVTLLNNSDTAGRAGNPEKDTLF